MRLLPAFDSSVASGYFIAQLAVHDSTRGSRELKEIKIQTVHSTHRRRFSNSSLEVSRRETWACIGTRIFVGERNPRLQHPGSTLADVWINLSLQFVDGLVSALEFVDEC